jgi:hypothetical protein
MYLLTSLRVSHECAVFLPLAFQTTFEVAYDALHQITLEMALDFIFEVDERFRVLIHRLHDVVSGLDPLLVPSIVSQILERSFELGQACEFISDDFANAGLDEELESICGSNGLSAFGIYRSQRVYTPGFIRRSFLPVVHVVLLRRFVQVPDSGSKFISSSKTGGIDFKTLDCIT